MPPMKATASTIVASTMAEPRSPCRSTMRRGQRQHEHHGAERGPQVVHAVGAPGQQVGGVDEEHELQQLGGLEAERTEVEPGPRPVDLDPEAGHEDGDVDGEHDQQAGPDERPHDVVRDAVGDEQRRRAERGPQRLAAEVGPARAALAQGVDRRRRQHHDEPEHAEDEDRDQQHVEAGRRGVRLPAPADLGDGRRRVAAHRLQLVLLQRPRPDTEMGRGPRHPSTPWSSWTSRAKSSPRSP